MIAPNSFSDSMPRSIVVDEHADARLTLPEEEVTDDRADDGESGRDAEASEDRGHRARQLEPPKTMKRLDLWSVKRSCWPWSAESRPNNVLLMIGNSAMSTHTITRAAEVEPEPEADERNQGEDRDRLQHDRVGEERSLEPLGLAHDDREEHAEHDRDRESDHRHLGRVQQPFERARQVVPVEERDVEHLVRRRHQEAASRREQRVGDEVPEADEEHEDDERPDDVDDERLPAATGPLAPEAPTSSRLPSPVGLTSTDVTSDLLAMRATPRR